MEESVPKFQNFLEALIFKIIFTLFRMPTCKVEIAFLIYS